MNIDSLVTVIVAVISSGSLWGFLQFVIGRRSEAARQEAEKESRRDERTKTLADAQALAQKTALDSANQAFRQVTRQCDKCYDELHALRAVTETLIDNLEAFMIEETTEARVAVRASIRAVRQTL